MKTLVYSIRINAGKQQVWDAMMRPDIYKEWVGAGWENAYYEGTWAQGEEVQLLSPGNGGTMMHLKEYRAYDYLFAEHVAVVSPDGALDRESNVAKGWVGSTESYTLTESNGQTEVKIEIHATPEWAGMFEEGWPNALAKLKEICER